MRITEIICESNAVTDAEFNLVTALELLRRRHTEEGQPLTIKTQSLINLVRNTDKNFDYNALVAASKKPSISGLIANVDNEEVEINTDEVASDDIGGFEFEPPETEFSVDSEPDIEFDNEIDEPSLSDIDSEQPLTTAITQPANTVSDMAKRAAKKLGTSVANESKPTYSKKSRFQKR